MSQVPARDAGGQPSVEGDSSLPVETVPGQPPSSPVPDRSELRVGGKSVEMGWRDTQGGQPPTVPGADPAFCGRAEGRATTQVWAHDSAVYTLTHTSCNPLARTPCDSPADMRLRVNKGGGWELVAEFDSADISLSGVKGYGALLAGTSSCPVSAVVDSADNLDLSCPMHLAELRQPQQETWSVVSGTGVAFARQGNDTYRLGEGSAVSLGDVEPGTFAGTESFLVTFTSGSAERLDADGSVPIEGVPAGPYHSANVSDEGRIFAGNGAGQIVELTSTGPVVHAVAGLNESVRHLWSVNETVFFATGTVFGKLIDGRAETLLELSAEDNQNFNSLWGISEKEVFLALRDAAFLNVDCGQEFLLWYDGEKVRSF